MSNGNPITSMRQYRDTYFPQQQQAANVIDYGQYQGNLGWVQPDYSNWYYGLRPLITNTTVIVNGHRYCSCPNCAGDCCDCAECKVKRLEKRVAELEQAKG